MASQESIDKAQALRKQIETAEARRAEIKAITNPTDAQQRELRSLNNQISHAQYQFRTDKDLLSLANENMSAGDKLSVFGLASGTVGGLDSPVAATGLLEAGVALQSVEEQFETKTEPETSKGKPDSTETTKQNTDAVGDPLPNQLHQYASYAYSLSWHLLTVDEYNKVVETQEYVANKVLVASAGRYNDIKTGDRAFNRSSVFSDDFYFEGLEFDTVIGITEMSRSTNAISLDFTLVEPYGMTLVNKVAEVCSSSEVGSIDNYTHAPYLLQIDFYGMDDTGNITGIISGITKRIPIKLVSMGINITNRGSEYKIKAVPFNHSAYDLTSVQTPANFEITAQTVAGFFQSSESEKELFKTVAIEERSDNNIARRTSNSDFVGPDGQINNNVTESLFGADSAYLLLKDPIYKVKSYGSAINSWNQRLTETNKIQYPDTYFFKFDKTIGESSITTEGTTSPKNTSMTNLKNKKEPISIRRTNIGASTRDLDYNVTTISINAGTTIDMLLNYIIRHSQYIREQIVIPESFATTDAYIAAKKKFADSPMSWFKIVPTVKLKNFDKIKQVWSRDITYHIVPYKVYNTKLDIMPQKTQTHPVKVYNYLYTGKNDDILDLELKFDFLYFTALTPYRSHQTTVNPMAQATEETRNTNPGGYMPQYEGVISNNPNAVQPNVIQHQYNSRESATGHHITAKDQAVADAATSLLSGSMGDMIQVKLSIIGDPDYIKQDDVFYPPRYTVDEKIDNTTDFDPRLTANGSLITDHGELYVQILFRTPTDLDESTGMMKFDKNQIAMFSGMYRVVRVVNKFSRGQFIQDLELVRMPRQSAYDYVVGNKLRGSESKKERTEDLNIDKGIGAGDTEIGAPDDSTASTAPGDEDVPTQAEPPAPDVTPDEPETSQVEDLKDIRENAEEEPITNQNEPTSEVPPPEPVTPVTLPDGVTQDRFGSYQYKGLTVPAGVEPGSAEFNRTITAIDNQQTIQVQAVNPSTGQTATREFNGDWKASNISRAENNVDFAESELKRFDQKVNSGFFDRDGKGISAETQAKLDAARERYVADVAAAKSTLSQAQQGDVVLTPNSR